MATTFDRVEDAISAIAAGELVVVVDDDDRENEGDLIMAGSKATTDKVAFMIRHTSGILCTPINEEHAKRLHLEPMVARNDAPLSTAFTVSIDYRKGLTTGISAEERANTVTARSSWSYFPARWKNGGGDGSIGTHGSGDRSVGSGRVRSCGIACGDRKRRRVR